MPPPSGRIPEKIARAFQDGLFELPARPSGLGTSVGPSVWRVPIILVSYADSATRYTGADFERVLFDTTHSTATGSVYDYYQWVSGGRLEVIGQVVGTVTLSQTRAYYGGNSWGMNSIGTPANAYGAVREAIGKCQSSVQWSDFDMDRDGYVDMLWFVHAGVGGEVSQSRDDMWSITTRMSRGWRDAMPYVTDSFLPGSSTLHEHIDRFTVLPELSAFSRGAISEIGVYCHEFGHALGLPDLYDTSNLSRPLNLGPGNWSLMSSGAYGTNGSSPQYPAHLGAWPLRFLGWDQTLRPARDTILTLDPVERSGSIVDWSFQGEASPEHFFIENRQPEGFDRNLPMSGLIITHVDEAMVGQRLATNTVNGGPTPGLWVVEADGDSDLVLGRNRGDVNDPFPGALGRTTIDDDSRASTRTFANTISNISLQGITTLGPMIRFTANVRAPGWSEPQEDVTTPVKPVDSFGSARISGIDSQGGAYVVSTELRAGTPQIMLRTNADSWAVPFQVSNSGRAALDPTLAVLPGGDLVVVWSDGRNGRYELYYRSRIRGAWTPERSLLRLSSDCRTPAIAADAKGMITLAFVTSTSGFPQVQCMRFTYFSPFGQPLPVTTFAQVPGSPGVAMGTHGEAYIAWTDRAVSPSRIWFATFHPDSGVSRTQPLSLGSFYPQLGFSMICDPAGTVHTVWQTSGPGLNQIHYQRREQGVAPSPGDSVIESRGSVVQNPVMAMGLDGDIHVAFEDARAGPVQVYYKRWQPTRGWDTRSTEISTVDNGDAARPQPLPTGPGKLTIEYIAYRSDGGHVMSRRRDLAPGTTTSVPRTRIDRSGLSIGPNPLIAGRALELSWFGNARSAAPVVGVYDLAGRRIASITMARTADGWAGSLTGEITRGWSSGVYFARIGAPATLATRLIVLK